MELGSRPVWKTTVYGKASLLAVVNFYLVSDILIGWRLLSKVFLVLRDFIPCSPNLPVHCLLILAKQIHFPLALTMSIWSTFNPIKLIYNFRIILLGKRALNHCWNWRMSCQLRYQNLRVWLLTSILSTNTLLRNNSSRRTHRYSYVYRLLCDVILHRTSQYNVIL